MPSTPKPWPRFSSTPPHTRSSTTRLITVCLPTSPSTCTKAPALDRIVRRAYEDYLGSGTNFCSWNNPATPADETFDTFMTLAYKFCAHAENSGLGLSSSGAAPHAIAGGVRLGIEQQYDQQHNTPAADHSARHCSSPLCLTPSNPTCAPNSARSASRSVTPSMTTCWPWLIPGRV